MDFKKQQEQQLLLFPSSSADVLIYIRSESIQVDGGSILFSIPESFSIPGLICIFVSYWPASLPWAAHRDHTTFEGVSFSAMAKNKFRHISEVKALATCE